MESTSTLLDELARVFAVAAVESALAEIETPSEATNQPDGVKDEACKVYSTDTRALSS